MAGKETEERVEIAQADAVGVAQAPSIPTYFPPATLHNRAGQAFTMIDGGVFANNPTICAIVEAYHLYHSTDFLIVSLGTGSVPVQIDTNADPGKGHRLQGRTIRSGSDTSALIP